MFDRPVSTRRESGLARKLEREKEREWEQAGEGEKERGSEIIGGHRCAGNEARHYRRIERMANTKDNCADSVQFFEGVEKLLEIWFTSSKGEHCLGDLRQIPR